MTDIAIHLDREAGRIKPLHGVNNGPEGYGTLVEVSHYFKRIEVPLVRLHDPNWPHAWECDIHTIFPDFSKDPNDPESYEFARSDTYIQRIIDTGAKVFFRLGESIEHTKKKYYVHPPADFEKWTQICANIIRHYNYGWANGFEHGIEYWEIWNEPDIGEKMWSGTPEQYYDLYRTAAPALKKQFPELKIGGPAIARVKSDLAPGFLQMCKDERLPLDFYSWHTYTADPEVVRSNALFVREQLDQYGFHDAESIFNEWNYIDTHNVFYPGAEYIRKEMFERTKGPEGASFAAAVLTLLQDCAVDAANYYDGQPSALYCGLFDYYGVPTKTYYAFEAFYKLTKLSQRVEAEVQSSAQGIYCCAAKDGREAAILISNFGGATKEYRLNVSGLDGASPACDVYRLDAGRNLEWEQSREVNGGELSLMLPKHTVTLVRLKAQ